jgi:tetratricopeptide (TPR) repeat protein
VERLQDPKLLGPLHALLGTTYSLMGDHDRATTHAQRALAPALECRDHATLGRTYYVLSMEDMWSGQWSQGVEHGQQAIIRLEQARDHGWLGQAYWITGANHMFLGAFAEALEAEAQVQRLGEKLSSQRLLSYAAWTTGLTHTLMGAWEQGITYGQCAVEQAPDPFCRTEAQGFLGYAYLEKGDAAAALPVLEQAAQSMRRFQFRQLEGWFTVWWGEAQLLAGEYDRARDLVRQGLEIVRDVGFRVVIGWGERVLGQIALAEGDYVRASQHVQMALELFTALQSRMELVRTLLYALAPLAQAQGQMEVVADHLRTATAYCQALQVPVYSAHTQRLAAEYSLYL